MMRVPVLWPSLCAVLGLAVMALPSAASAGARVPAPAAPMTCAALAAPGLFPQTTVTSAATVAADPARGLPAYCEVKGTISPVRASRIGVVYRLPQNWNGKLLGLGGDGWAGDTALQAAAPGLAKGYAVAQTNGGHESATAFDSSWTKDAPEAVADFSYRAVHLMTTTGKLVVARYYAKPQARAYFQGCSTGGRMALMEAQRFPTDYDGIIAGAPVYNLITQTSSIVRTQIFAPPGAQFSDAQLALVNRAVLRACDGDDGIRDGVLADPRTCRWDPLPIQCPPGPAAAQCLSPAQVAALRKAYSVVRPKKGGVSAYALTRGGEAGWSRLIATGPGADSSNGGGLGDMRKTMFGDADFDLAAFDPEKHQAMVRSTPFAKAYEAADPDLSKFIKGGGKLVLWHGWDDPGPSPYATIDYFEAVQKTTGPRLGKQSLASSARFFLAPGVYHCGGGPGPDQFNLLGTLERWVEAGAAPDAILASKRDSPLSRPLCPYPTVARFKGEGDPNDPRNFACR